MIVFPLLLKNITQIPQYHFAINKFKINKFQEKEIISEIIMPKIESAFVSKETEVKNEPVKVSEVTCHVAGSVLKIQETGNILCVLESLPVYFREKLIGASQKILDDTGYDLLIIKCLKSAQKK